MDNSFRKLYKSLGLAGDIEAETEGLLLANDVDTREFSAAALSSLPITEEVEWTIDEVSDSCVIIIRRELLCFTKIWHIICGCLT